MTPRQRQSKLKEGSLDRKTPHEADAYVTTFLSLLSLTATDNLPRGRLTRCLGSQRMADAVSLPQVRWPDLRHQGVMSGDR